MVLSVVIRYISGMLFHAARTLLLCSLLLSGCQYDSPRSSKEPDYSQFGPCDTPEDSRLTTLLEESLCGTLSVYEDRKAGTGRTIDLNIMVLPATTSARRPDPIFFLAGGPGQSAVDVGPLLFARLADLRKERDIVLVDQRGTGHSASLACESSIPAFEQLTLTSEEVIRLQLGQLKKCLAEYDADPSLYTTPVAMDDLDEVRRRLGFDQINLIGISYGTRAALVYIRRHEDAVRSAILDAVAPMNMVIPAKVAVDAQAAFDKLLKDCNDQPGCRRAFPGMEEHLHDLIARLKTAPEPVSLVHPRTGKEIKGKIDHLTTSGLIRSALYDRTLSQLLPFAIEQAAENNFQPLSTLSYAMTGDEEVLSIGMMASVLCSEDMTRVNTLEHTDLFENPLHAGLIPICKFWPRGEIPDDYFEPVRSSVPVLLTSGTLDPVTPPKYAWQAAATLRNSEHIVVPGVGHGALLTGCMPEIAAEFIDRANPRGIDAGCALDIRRPPFFTGVAGPVEVEGPGSNTGD